jgi:hypothetical protein
VRGRGDCLQTDFDVWVGGYPRSSNSFATAALKLGNPGMKVATHWHIPAFIINAVQRHKPGILMLRHPIDAAVSWTLFWEGRLTIDQALDYYLDFHQALVSLRPQLFVATFEEATGAFHNVVERFNQKFGTSVSSLPMDEVSTNRCLAYVEHWFRSPSGLVNEFKVPRPSSKRTELKKQLLQRIKTSRQSLQRIGKAEHLYSRFLDGQAAPTISVERDSVEPTLAHPSVG